jgi:hypothetical protein
MNVDDVNPSAHAPYYEKFQKMHFKVSEKLEKCMHVYPRLTLICADFGIQKRPCMTYT